VNEEDVTRLSTDFTPCDCQTITIQLPGSNYSYKLSHCVFIEKVSDDTRRIFSIAWASDEIGLLEMNELKTYMKISWSPNREREVFATAHKAHRVQVESFLFGVNLNIEKICHYAQDQNGATPETCITVINDSCQRT